MAETIGSRLKWARVRAGYSQGELAVACGWGKNPAEAQSRVSNYERNAREMTLDDLIRMCAVLKCNPAEIAFGHPIKPNPKEMLLIDAYRYAVETGDEKGQKYLLSAADAVRPAESRKLRKVGR